MGRKRVSGPQSGAHRGGHRKAPPGLHLKERDGHWHIIGTMRAGGRSIRVRKSTDLAATEENREYAETIRLKIETDVRNAAIHGIKPSIDVIVAVDRFIRRKTRKGKKKGPVGKGEIRKLHDVIRALAFKPAHLGEDLFQHIAAGGTVGAFLEVLPAKSLRELSDISEQEWIRFIEKRHAGNKPETRERYLNSIVSFLNWCSARPRCWIKEVPAFERNQTARNPEERRARRVTEMTPKLIRRMIENAAPHLVGQLAAEWATGARVSSVLYGCRLCDLVIIPGREQITYADTKTGLRVTAALHPEAATLMRQYLEWRGKPHDREGPLFLTHRRLPYADNQKEFGGQNKTAFNGMKRRTIAAIRKEGADKARGLRARGKGEEARAAIDEAKSLGGLVKQITQHWFRHNLATVMLSKSGDLGAVMKQGGWLTAESVLGYTHDVSDHRRSLVNKIVEEETPADLPGGGQPRSSKMVG